jgi:hypothetical protein
MKENSMQRSEPKNNSSQRLARKTCVLSGILMAFWIVGCGGSTSPSTPATSQSAVQNYFAPFVSGSQNTNPLYVVDDAKTTFSQETFALNLPEQIGLQVLNAGDFTANQRGLRSLGILTTYSPFNALGENTGIYVPTNYPAPGLPGSFAVELAGQAGGLVQMVGQPVEPLVAATQCPNFTSAQPYQFVTIPGSEDLTLVAAAPGSSPGSPAFEQNGTTWNPTTDTAYGSVDIVVSSGNTVTFQNIDQHTLPSVGGTRRPTQQSASSVMSACGSTTLGNVTGIPGQYVVTDPGTINGASGPPQAAVGIGSTGLLVEDNGSRAFGLLAGTSPGIHYENVLGAGTGAVGLPKPSSALDTSSVVGAQYLGFIYAAGASSPAVTWSSHLASFGFSSLPSPKCASFAAQTGTLSNGIYGGDFPQNNGQDNPSASTDGFGNCDFAIDLGTQIASNNSLYSQATVWIGGDYAGNLTHTTYSFSAVAIAGQLNGKYAIFLIGVDSNQPWAIYLLQSN